MQQFSDKDETYGHPQPLRWVPFVPFIYGMKPIHLYGSEGN